MEVHVPYIYLDWTNSHYRNLPFALSLGVLTVFTTTCQAYSLPFWLTPAKKKGEKNNIIHFHHLSLSLTPTVPPSHATMLLLWRSFNFLFPNNQRRNSNEKCAFKLETERHRFYFVQYTKLGHRRHDQKELKATTNYLVGMCSIVKTFWKALETFFGEIPVCILVQTFGQKS